MGLAQKRFHKLARTMTMRWKADHEPCQHRRVDHTKCRHYSELQVLQHRTGRRSLTEGRRIRKRKRVTPLEVHPPLKQKRLLQALTRTVPRGRLLVSRVLI